MGAMINEDRFGVVQLAIDPASVAANTTAEQTFTLKGVKPGDFVKVNKPTLTAGIGVFGARASAADTIGITFGNFTAGALDPPLETYLVWVFRPEKTPTAFNV